MIKLFIFCLLVSVGYVPCVSAYALIDAPPVEREVKNKKKRFFQKKKTRKKYTKQNKVKGSTILFTVGLIWSLSALSLSLIGLALGFTTYIYIVMIVFLLAALICLILGYVQQAKEKNNIESSDNNDSTLGNSSGNMD